MTFINKDKGRGLYGLFSIYSYYLPGFGGMMMLLVMFLLGAMLGNGLLLILGSICPPEFISLYGTVISYPVMFIPPMIYASMQSRKAELMNLGDAKCVPMDSNGFGTHGGLLLSLTVMSATIAMAYVTEPVGMLLPPMPQWLEEMMKKMLMDCPVWITLISVSVFAPFFEEWLCRGMILRGMLTRLRPWQAILVSAAFFAVIHMNPWQAIPAFLIGILFGYVYYKTGSLKLTMLMHCTNNTMAVIVSQIPSLQDAETFMEVLTPSAYWGTFIGCIVILAGAVIVFRTIPAPASFRTR